MAKQTVLCTPDNSTDAAFRGWGSAISTALQALFVKVTQAGEIDWGTVTKPTTATDSMGFEVYRFNDSLQGTAPIYFKFEYGSGPGSASRFGVWITVGKGADGSGTITGTLLARVQAILSSSTLTASAKNCYIGNGDGSCLVMSLWPSDAGMTNSMLVLERSRDDNGNPTAAAVMWQYSGAANSIGYQFYGCIDYTAMTAVSLPFGCINIQYPLTANVSLSNGENTPVFVASCLTTQRVAWVPTSLMGVAQADFGAGVVATALNNGIDYLALGSACPYADIAKQQYASAMIRWD